MQVRPEHPAPRERAASTQSSEDRVASFPVRRRVYAAIDKAGGEDYIFQQVIDGKPIRKIMDEFDVSRGMFYRWLKEDKTGDREAAYEAAKKISAETHAEMEGLLLEEAAAKGHLITPGEVGLLRLRADYHRYLARIRDREQFSEKQGDINLNMNFGDTHLQALRELGRATLRPPPSAPEVDDIQDADYEMLDN